MADPFIPASTPTCKAPVAGLTFRAFLLRFAHKESPEGNFAFDAVNDPNFPAYDLWSFVDDYLRSRHAYTEARDTCRELWIRWRFEQGILATISDDATETLRPWYAAL